MAISETATATFAIDRIIRTDFYFEHSLNPGQESGRFPEPHSLTVAWLPITESDFKLNLQNVSEIFNITHRQEANGTDFLALLSESFLEIIVSIRSVPRRVHSRGLWRRGSRPGSALWIWMIAVF